MATATDLVRAARCEFAVLRALDAELGMLDAVAGAPGPTGSSGSPASSGSAPLHARMRAEYGSSIAEIAPHNPLSTSGTGADALRAAHAATLGALRAGARAVRNATFLTDGFAACCAYLVRDEQAGLVLHGTADSPGTRIDTVLELAACAEITASAGIAAGSAPPGGVGAARIAPALVVHCGSAVSEHPLDTAAAVYRARRERVGEILEEKLGELLPVQWGDPRYLACGQCPVCLPELTAARDLLLVAGMPGTVRARLRDAGVHTIDRLAVLDDEVPGLSARTVAALRDQAGLQLRTESSGAPAYALLDPVMPAALPPAHPDDLALTVEFGPTGRAERWRLGDRGGTLLSVPAGHRPVTQVLGYADAHLRAHPGAHLYHYAGEVRTALLSQGDGLGDEELLDDLLHARLLVDLYPVVRNAVLIGVGSYRLDRLRALLPDDRPDDVALLLLSDWLRRLPESTRRHESAVATPHPGEDQRLRPTQPDGHRTDGGAQSPPPPPSSVEAALAEYAAEQDDSAHPAAVMAAILGYRRRERRASSWAHTDRLTHPVREWADAPGVLIADWGTVDTKWHRSPDGATMRRFLTLTGRIGSGGGLRPGPTGTAAPAALPPGTRVHTFYDRVGAFGRRTTGTAVVLGCTVDADFDDAVRLEEILPEDGAPYGDLPIAIAPGVPEWDFRAEAAVEATAQRLLMTLPELPSGAFFDILGRRAPRLHSGALPPVHGDHLAALTAAVAGLDDSYLVVQGPSGTGKTDVTARVVAQLVTRRHWRIGIVAHSRPTVENLFEAIVAAGVLPELVAESEAETVAPEWAVIDPQRFARFLDQAVNGCVIGGLPGDFTDPARVPAGSLDLLVVADAGRFPLAEVAAVAGGARSLLLVGDPQPALARAAHPAPVADSVLGWLLDGRDTVPAGRGYFLDRTRRMHPRVCGPLSRLYYDGRLSADEMITTARQLDGVAPGIETVTVSHHGDSTESVTEAREVVRQVRGLLGRSWSEGGQTRRLHPHDLFVIAPYEAQVGRIRTLLARAKIEDVLVGTVDRFRGRETAVVLISMTTSAPQDAPDGMAALFSPGLIRAAVSRAMWKAIVIRSPLLTAYLPETPEELTEPGRFLRLG
ncbi:bifunctional RecB family nuclease/DEAD/DEAH box helicase [Nocardia higoensis]|uniref:bifunctional RecB family nuclease/DEAD/DEAH box helicase n=1 Tax=Nocardia higoensis TaxID=228599 RepID=UPI001FDF2495|nr:bifunctional RecB family nuclease/DEAD/DEAH box helicase [Nocardia higoensis]